MAISAETGNLVVGPYRLEVGATPGTLITPAAPDRDGDAEAERLARALAEDPGRIPKRGGQERAERALETAEEVTGQAEEAVALFNAFVEGKLTDTRELAKRADSLLDLLERLDENGRWEDELRLARALNRLLALLFRWADLIRSLHLFGEAAERFLRLSGAAAERLEDAWSVLAWSEHELGTLHVAAGDPGEAHRRLKEARRIRERIEDDAGLAATEQSQGVLCRRLPDSWLRRMSKRSRRLVLALLVVLLLVVGGVAGAVVVDGDPSQEESVSKDGPNPDGPERGRAQLAVLTDGAGTVTSKPARIRCPDRCERDFARRSLVRLTAEASEDSVFAGWRGGGCKDTGECRVRLTRDTTVRATFSPRPPELRTLKVVPPVNGSVRDASGIACPQMCQRPLPVGTKVTLVPEADDGFVFAEWGGDCSDSGECSVTLTADRTVTATFRPQPTVEVSVSTKGDGSVTSVPVGIACPGDCKERIPAGQMIVLTGSEGLTKWLDGCEGTEPSSPCTLTPQADTAVLAAF